jgi:RNA-directed DNA polymerase
MQALHLIALAPVAETLGDPNSYGFRSGRSTAVSGGANTVYFWRLQNHLS